MREGLEQTKDGLGLAQSKEELVAKLKAAEMEVVRLKDYEEWVDDTEEAMKSSTGGDYGSIDEVGDLARGYMRQKDKIAELENLLAIDGLRITQAWKQIEELKKQLLTLGAGQS